MEIHFDISALKYRDEFIGDFFCRISSIVKRLFNAVECLPDSKALVLNSVRIRANPQWMGRQAKATATPWNNTRLCLSPQTVGKKNCLSLKKRVIFSNIYINQSIKLN